MNFKYACALLISIVFFSACKKQNDNVFLANETTTGFEGYSSIDSLKIQTCTVLEDSLKTDSLSHNLVGIINDPEIGTYSASTFAQFKLPQLGNVISSNTLDSVVLFLQFTSKIAHYGNLSSVNEFDVFELNQSMNSSVTHSNQTYTYDPTPIGTFSGVFHVEDSMNMRNLGKTIKAAPGVSIKLSGTFAQKLFNANSGNLSSQENFLSFMKGLALVPKGNPSAGNGAIAAFNLKGSYTMLRIYYNDTLQSDFTVQTDSRRFSQYTHTGNLSQITQQLSFGGNADFDTTYVVAMARMKTKIKFPNLFSIIKNNGKFISIGKAEIIIRPVFGSYDAPYTLPSRMLLFSEDEETGLNTGLVDFLEPFFGGEYNSTHNYYKFNITRYIQSLFIDYQQKGIDNNRGLFLAIPTDFPIAPSRILVDSRKGMQNAGIEFKLIYTEL